MTTPTARRFLGRNTAARPAPVFLGGREAPAVRAPFLGRITTRKNARATGGNQPKGTKTRDDRRPRQQKSTTKDPGFRGSRSRQ